MSGITYRKLKEALAELTEEHLDMTATISTGNPDKDSSEFFAIVDLKLVLDNGILDENHPVLVTNINNSVKESYPKGACPDCGTDIPHDAPEGWNCPNCNHACYSD